jgi:uncharacterized protein (DUF608 family)
VDDVGAVIAKSLAQGRGTARIIRVPGPLRTHRGTSYPGGTLAAFMIGRGLVEEGWDTARGAAEVTYERGLWFRTPEVYDEHGDFRASIYLRPLAIWAIEEALRRARRTDSLTGIHVGDNPTDRHPAGTEGEP